MRQNESGQSSAEKAKTWNLHKTWCIAMLSLFPLHECIWNIFWNRNNILWVTKPSYILPKEKLNHHQFQKKIKTKPSYMQTSSSLSIDHWNDKQFSVALKLKKLSTPITVSKPKCPPNSWLKENFISTNQSHKGFVV